jgi:hypothetical protein
MRLLPNNKAAYHHRFRPDFPAHPGDFTVSTFSLLAFQILLQAGAVATDLFKHSTKGVKLWSILNDLH